MLIYEVNLAVDGDAAEAMAVWLRAHIGEMVALDGFEGAAWYQREPEDGRQQWTVHYRLAGHRALQVYLDEHAGRMRQDGMDRFGGRFTATRRVLYARETFS